MRDLFAAYDLRIVDSDPGNVPHMEAVFGGNPTQVGMDANVLGVSPFTLDCSIIENSVVFTFTNAFSFTPREACEIMAQEVAHSYGLDHELLASDPMTYLEYTGNRTFKDQTASCGEDMAAPRQCGINGSVCRTNQNSVQLLRDRLGIADAIAPTLAFSSPPNNSTVPPGFQVKVSGSDNNGVTGAVLKIDGIQRDMLDGAGPFVFTTSQTLAEGAHTIVVELSDGKNLKSDTRAVTVKIGALPPQDETDDANGDVIGGCAAGGGNSSALFALGLLAALTARRRRRRR
jgi:MYXO-CTERM domain-containing protein